jgi:hypothetical protein
MALYTALKRRSSTVVSAVAIADSFRDAGRRGQQVPRFARNDNKKFFGY